jgi:hypothetical protein
VLNYEIVDLQPFKKYDIDTRNRWHILVNESITGQQSAVKQIIKVLYPETSNDRSNPVGGLILLKRTVRLNMMKKPSHYLQQIDEEKRAVIYVCLIVAICLMLLVGFSIVFKLHFSNLI